MNFQLNLLRLVILLAIACNVGLRSAVAQYGELGDLGNIFKNRDVKGVLSFRATSFSASQTNVRLFLAAWFEPLPQERTSGRNYLLIYEKVGTNYKEVFRYDDRVQSRLQDLAPMTSISVPGVVVTFQSDVGWNGPTVVIALLHGSSK